PGEEVFRLYDTYGFPKELTEEYVEEHGFTIDEDGFEKEMDKQRERARSARQQTDSMQIQDEVFASLDAESTFTGYDKLVSNTSVQEIIQDKQKVDHVSAGQEALIVLAQTPFYAESGGQIADKGIVLFDGGEAEVIDVQKAPKGQHLHR